MKFAGQTACYFFYAPYPTLFPYSSRTDTVHGISGYMFMFCGLSNHPLPSHRPGCGPERRHGYARVLTLLAVSGLNDDE
jgi:hypothetical protein